MKLAALSMICLSAIGSLSAAETIGEVFQQYFEIQLPEEYQVTYAGGKEGEKQFSLLHHQRTNVISLFVYYDGLDPRNWQSYFEDGKDVFLYHKDQVFVYAQLPANMSFEVRSVVTNILNSIKEKTIQPAPPEGTPEAGRP